MHQTKRTGLKALVSPREPTCCCRTGTDSAGKCVSLGIPRCPRPRGWNSRTHCHTSRSEGCSGHSDICVAKCVESVDSERTVSIQTTL